MPRTPITTNFTRRTKPSSVWSTPRDDSGSTPISFDSTEITFDSTLITFDATNDFYKFIPLG